MARGKTIASMFALAGALGILGAACTARIEETGAVEEALDEPCVEDEGTSAEALTSDPNRGLNRDREERRDHRDRRERERCERRCEEAYRDCLRGHDHDRDRDHGRSRCARRRSYCRSECRRLWD